MNLIIRMLCWLALFASTSVAERIHYAVEGRISGSTEFSSFSYPLMGTVDVLIDEFSGQLTFENEEIQRGDWTGIPDHSQAAEFVETSFSENNKPVADFSNSASYLVSLAKLAGEVRGDTVYFHDRPVGYIPPWGEGAISDPIVLTGVPWFFGTATEGKFEDRDTLHFLREKDMTAVDGGRSALYLQLRAVPEPASELLLLIGLAIAMRSCLGTRRGKLLARLSPCN